MTLPPHKPTIDARKVADHLEQAGDPFRANVIRRVCRSLDVARSTLSVLHRDNVALRRQASRVMNNPSCPDAEKHVDGVQCPECER